MLQGKRGSESLALLWASGEMPLGSPAVVLLPGHRAWSDVFELRRGHYHARLAGRCHTLLSFCKGLPEGRGMVWGVSAYGLRQITTLSFIVIYILNPPSSRRKGSVGRNLLVKVQRV